MRRSVLRYAAIAAVGLLGATATPAAATTAYEDGETVTTTAPDFLPDGHAVAEADADPSNGTLAVSTSVAAAMSPSPSNVTVRLFDDVGFGLGASAAEASASVSRTLEVSPGTHRLTVTLSGLTATASSEGEKASSQTRAWLEAIGDPGSGTAGLYRGGQVLEVATVTVTVQEYVLTANPLACAPAKPECTTPDTLVLEATISADEAIWVAVGISSSARASNGLAEASVTATAGVVTITTLES